MKIYHVNTPRSLRRRIGETVLVLIFGQIIVHHLNDEEYRDARQNRTL